MQLHHTTVATHLLEHLVRYRLPCSHSELIALSISASIALETAAAHALTNLDAFHLQEFYGDYIAVNPHLFSLNILGCCQVWKARIFKIS